MKTRFPFSSSLPAVLVTALACAAATLPLHVRADNDDDDEDGVTVRREVVIQPEVTRTFVDGYVVPQQYHTHFTPLPPPSQPNVVLRYHNGRAYYLDSNDWKVVKVVTLNPSSAPGPGLSAEVNTYVEGASVPVEHRTHFVELPPPSTGVTVRYYNGTAYYMDGGYKIVRTVRLVPVN